VKQGSADKPTSAPPLALISFDVEEFDLPNEYGGRLPLHEQLRVGAEGWERTLDLLDEVGVRATLFVTATIATAHPELLARSAQRHEIASHGWSHSHFEPQDLSKSREVLQKLSGQEVSGFRMARLARVDQGLIALAGYGYNSGENPTWVPGRYNNFFRPRHARVEETGRGEIVQIPTAVTPLVRWPLFWLSFKNVPLGVTKVATRWCLGADGVAALYFHPWELCEVGKYRLPRLVAGLDGERYVARMREYLEWLKDRAACVSYAEHAQQVKQAAQKE
jgi:hypothetical protein